MVEQSAAKRKLMRMTVDLDSSKRRELQVWAAEASAKHGTTISVAQATRTLLQWMLDNKDVQDRVIQGVMKGEGDLTPGSA